MTAVKVFNDLNGGAPRARGAPLIRKCGNPSMREILLSRDRATVRTYVRTSTPVYKPN